MDKEPLSTAWAEGAASAFSAPGGQAANQQARFRILFGQVYEDPAIEKAAFAGLGRVFCIASAGNTALSLAAEHEVVACDINPVQLSYAEARAHGAKPQRGDAERAMYAMLKLAPLAGWTAETLRHFLALDDTEAQIEFWCKRMDTARFRLGCRLLFSRALLRKVYSKALLDSLPASFGSILRHRLERGFARHPNASNPYARMLLLGEMIDLPYEYPKRISFVHNDAASYLESCPAASFEALSLSNIMDGATPEYCRRLVRAVQHAAIERAPVVWRSFGEPRSSLNVNLAKEDRSMLWGVVRVTTVEALGEELA